MNVMCLENHPECDDSEDGAADEGEQTAQACAMAWLQQ
jgi:hypothetical protein